MLPIDKTAERGDLIIRRSTLMRSKKVAKKQRFKKP
jgi:hypothetical protein